VNYPLDNDVMDYYLDFKLKRYRHWDALVEKYEYNPAVSYYNIIVPTQETVRYG